MLPSSTHCDAQNSDEHGAATFRLSTVPVPGMAISALMGIDSLLHLTHALEETMAVAKLRIDLVTRGAQPAGIGMGATAVAQAPSIGIFRVILGEHPNFACRGIDLPSVASSNDRGLLWSELLHSDTEREVALRGEARYVQRITRGF